MLLHFSRKNEVKNLRERKHAVPTCHNETKQEMYGELLLVRCQDNCLPCYQQPQILMIISMLYVKKKEIIPEIFRETLHKTTIKNSVMKVLWIKRITLSWHVRS